MTQQSEDWAVSSDIPEHPTEQLIGFGSGGRRWESEPMPVGTFAPLLDALPRVSLPEPRRPAVWICLDCTAECENDQHSWARAVRIEQEDGSGAWLVEPKEQET